MNITESGWYVTNEGTPFTGPFTTLRDANTVRDYLEFDHGNAYGVAHFEAKPAVELPEKPTLGWVIHPALKPRLGAWVHTGETLHAMRHADFDPAEVEKFVEAIAVPRDAYEALEGWDHVDFAHSREGAAIHDFCRAVREANGSKP